MGLYNERFPFPQKVVHSIDKDGLGEEVKREGKTGVIREIEVDVLLDENCAIALHKWLGEKISSLQQARETVSDA